MFFKHLVLVVKDEASRLEILFEVLFLILVLDLLIEDLGGNLVGILQNVELIEIDELALDVLIVLLGETLDQDHEVHLVLVLCDDFAIELLKFFIEHILLLIKDCNNILLIVFSLVDLLDEF